MEMIIPGQSADSKSFDISSSWRRNTGVTDASAEKEHVRWHIVKTLHGSCTSLCILQCIFGVRIRPTCNANCIRANVVADANDMGRMDQRIADR